MNAGIKSQIRTLPAFMRSLTHRIIEGSCLGFAIGMLFFCLSLTPSLLPRTSLLQGMLSGVCFAAGYGTGRLIRSLWCYLELPVLKGTALRSGRLGCLGIALLASGFCLWKAREWQNVVRRLMELEPVEGNHLLQIVGVSLLVALALIGLVKLIQLGVRRISHGLRGFIPRRVANVLGVILGSMLIVSLFNRLVVTRLLELTDHSLKEIDEWIEPEASPPQAPEKSGSVASLVAWDQLGKQGRNYVRTGPSREAISEFTGKSAKEPIRVYVGLSARESPRDRAQLAVEELKRTGAFERSVLILATPTGTGWMDEQAVDPVEYLHHGDIATVAVQYSYLPSWLSLWVQPEYGSETARALFELVYEYWTSLPKAQRPRLYVYGLSLGSLNSQKAADIYDVLADPFHGALWSGPPFASHPWRTITNHRVAGSPEWLPVFRNSSLVRFSNQTVSAAKSGTPWGPIRIVYLQYASDPIVFISPEMIYRRPSWMEAPRGHDVTPQLRWYPVVTFLQLAVDVVLATEAPIGYGHVYAAEHYLEAWKEVTAAEDWSPSELEELKEHFRRFNREKAAQ